MSGTGGGGGGSGGGFAARRPFFRRRKTCPFSGPNAPKIDYKDVRLLQRFISERGKIVPSRFTAVSAKKQRELALLLGRDCSDAARHDLAALGDEAQQQLHVLVVDLRCVRSGERAGLAPPEERPARRRTAAHAALAVAATFAPAFPGVAHASPPAAGTAAGTSPSRGSRSP